VETPQRQGIQSPLQLFGLYLAWTESALAAGLFATGSMTFAQTVLVWVMAIGLVAYVLVAGFLLIYLVVRRPEFLFNPRDFDPSVQHLLFGATVPTVVVSRAADVFESAPASDSRK